MLSHEGEQHSRWQAAAHPQHHPAGINQAQHRKRAQAHRRHILTKKPSKRKRQLGPSMQVHETDVGRLEKLLPHL